MMHASLPATHLGAVLSGRYRLERVLGEGASSWVFAARDLRLERDVALKLFKIGSSEDELKRRRRCVAEGRTLAKLVHPHIVAVHDAIDDEAGQAYLVVELCEAGTLDAEVIQSGRLAPQEALELVLPLLGALAFAHDRNVIHRDIKPSNIVLIEEHGRRRCKVLDFGISLGLGAGHSSDLALGTPSFMAPEQARGESATAASDVWALGIVLFYCMSGELPFKGANPAAVLHQVTQQRAPRFASICKQLGPHLALALDRALEPNLSRRYRDMRSFARALAAACALDGVPVMAQPDPVGLPHFATWLTDATAQSTEPLPVAEYGPVPGSRDGTTSRRFARAALAAALVVAVGMAWSLLGRQRNDLHATHERRPEGQNVGMLVAQPTTLVGDEPVVPTALIPASALPPPAANGASLAPQTRQRRLISTWDW
jgi:serine/threonine protein kinase